MDFQAGYGPKAVLKAEVAYTGMRVYLVMNAASVTTLARITGFWPNLIVSYAARASISAAQDPLWALAKLLTYHTVQFGSCSKRQGP